MFLAKVQKLLVEVEESEVAVLYLFENLQHLVGRRAALYFFDLSHCPSKHEAMVE